MKTVIVLFLLGGAGVLLIGIVVLVRLWLAGTTIVFLPGLELVVSMGMLLTILTALEMVLIILVVMVWRS